MERFHTAAVITELLRIINQPGKCKKTYFLNIRLSPLLATSNHKKMNYRLFLVFYVIFMVRHAE